MWIHPDFVDTHPEVIMEIVGYARSPLCTEGLHLLIDVGATTLDAATFIIHNREGEDHFPLLETKVERYGTMVLHKRRIQALKNSLQSILCQKYSIDPAKPLPELAYYEIQTGMDAEVDVTFFQQCSKIIGEVIHATQKNRDPNSRAWDEGLPVFICGGGGRYPAYREIIETLGSRLSKTNFHGFNIKQIPKPDQLKAPKLSLKGYDRLAIAYGLSFTSFEIGQVIPESKIPDIGKEEKRLNLDDRFISKDMC